jgi:hypothetical protein
MASVVEVLSTFAGAEAFAAALGELAALLLPGGARVRCARATGRASRCVCAPSPRGAVPDGLVASYDAEARAYNPDHDVYILAYYQNYHLISLSRHINHNKIAIRR